jgi:SAM-dependent methyltransferase
MKPASLFQIGGYSLAWVKDFYDQTGIWWGPNTDVEIYASRLNMVERLGKPGQKRILDLGAGPGGNAAAMADFGHCVVAVEISTTRAEFARELAKAPRTGLLTVLEADFYTLDLREQFDVVCCWEVFGLGSDADQRRLLRRIAGEWLAPGGCVLMDVYSPYRPAHDSGSAQRLSPLPGVPGSVEMIEKCHFDPLRSRWIDEWQPTAAPEKALAQTIRCYSPADFLLLVEGTGLELERIEVEDQVIDPNANTIATGGPLMQAWSYVVKLVPVR